MDSIEQSTLRSSNDGSCACETIRIWSGFSVNAGDFRVIGKVSVYSEDHVLPCTTMSLFHDRSIPDICWDVWKSQQWQVTY